MEEIAQLFVNGLVAGTLLAVPAIGFTVIFAVLRFPNFAAASHATVGALAGYVANVYLGVPATPSTCLARYRSTRRRLAGSPSGIPTRHHRITNGFAIGSLDRFIQMVFGRV